MRIIIEPTGGGFRVRAEQPDGAFITVETYTSRVEAEATCAILRAERDRLKPRARVLRVGDWLSSWMLERTAGERRLVELHVLTDPIARLSMRGLRRRDVRAFRDRLAAKAALQRSEGGKFVEAERTLKSQTQRNAFSVLRCALDAAVEAEVMRHNPAREVRLPAPAKRRALSYLYPDEEARLASCLEVPLAYRMAYGVLAREGMRKGELLSLSWAELELERSVVVLDENKTDDPRSWALDVHVARALATWKAGRSDNRPTDRVFVGALGKPLGTLRCHRFRSHLLRAGIHRAELFATSEVRQPVRVHDLRATFVTLALAAGRTETWVQDRTGHTTSAMLGRYRRLSRTAREIGLGWLWPLDRLIAANITLKKGLTGAKPTQFCEWLFDLMGLGQDDELVDLFPGTGAVTSAWHERLIAIAEQCRPRGLEGTG